MNAALLEQLSHPDVKAKIVPIECLSRLAADIRNFKETEQLNGFQRWIVDEGYVLQPPELPFKPVSVLTVAVKCQLVNVTFEHAGKSIKDLYFTDQLGKLREFLGTLAPKDQYNLEFVFWLPNKRLAVCTGLAEYGRNNITYIDGWGNYFVLYSYLTDMPCDGDYVWRDMQTMAQCAACGACIQNCPTKAIGSDRFLIDNEICFTHFEESDQPFPDWLPKSAYQSVFGCFRCQEVCPENKSVLQNIDATVSFDETDTALLMIGLEKDKLPGALLSKLE